MQITFQCRAPETCEELTLKGISAFDAAIHCASISAAERQRAVQTAKDIETAQQQQQQCQHEFQSAHSSGQLQEQVSTSAASPASAVLPHRFHSSRVVPADTAAGQLASTHHFHHHQHQRHHSQHERRTAAAAASLLGVHGQQVEEHSLSVADVRVGEPQAAAAELVPLSPATPVDGVNSHYYAVHPLTAMAPREQTLRATCNGTVLHLQVQLNCEFAG